MGHEVCLEVLSPKGKRNLNVNSDMDTTELRRLVSELLDYPIDKCCLICKGRILVDSQSLEEASLLQENARLFVALDDPAKEEAAKAARGPDVPQPPPFVEQLERLSRQLARSGEASRIDGPAQSLRVLQEAVEQQTRNLQAASGERSSKADLKSFDAAMTRQMRQLIRMQRAGPVNPNTLIQRKLNPEFAELYRDEDEDDDDEIGLPAAGGQKQQHQQSSNPLDLLRSLVGSLGEPNEPSKEELEQKLRQLNEMGFADEAENLKALHQTGYDVFDAVAKLPQRE